MFKVLAASTLACVSNGVNAHGAPSSLLQVSANEFNVGANVIADIKKQAAVFQKQMEDEVLADKEEVRKLKDMQRKMERDDAAYRAKVFARTHRKGQSESAGSLIETNSHFGDPYIDEAMRVFGDEIENQKRELERVVSTHRQDESSLAQTKETRPELGIIASALKTRLAMVGKN